MKKLTLILDQTNWLEATWVEEIITINEVEGKKVEAKEVTQVHCESYSGHKEHISMLRAKALEFETSLEDYEDLIAECETNFIAPSESEIQAEIIKNLVAEAKNYLASTDWVNSYKLRHDLGLEVIPEDSLKWEVIKQRETYIEFLKTIK